MFLLTTTPLDITEKILLEAGWQAILKLRSVSKSFKQLTHLRALWISIVKDHQDWDVLSSAFELPLSQYTTEQLESIFLRWQRVSRRWRHIDNRSFTDVTELPLPEGHVHQMVMIPGGRWILMLTQAWSVVYIDLGSKDSIVQTLIPPQVEDKEYRYPCQGDLTFHDASIQGDNGFSFMLGVAFGWRERTATDTGLSNARAIVQAWCVQHIVSEDGAPTGLEANLVTSIAVPETFVSVYDVGFTALSRSQMLYYSKKPYLDDDCDASLLRIDLRPDNVGQTPVDITSSPPHFNTSTKRYFVRFINDSCVVYVRDNKVIILRHNPSGAPYTSILYSLEIPEFRTQEGGISQLSERFRIGKTSRFTLYYVDKVWGIIIPDACLQADGLEIGNIGSPQVIVIARFPHEYAESYTISHFCAYRHVLLCLSERNRPILAKFSWPDDALLVSQGGVQRAMYITPVRLRVNWEMIRPRIQETPGVERDFGEEEEQDPIETIFFPPPLLSLDEVSGQIAVYEREVGYVVRLR
ncbi:hypothetical protein BJ165DRAFT_1616668 [Panaeolus papilionaceus]|nr:hypothetical protein BJ165DRAFT_1616668 [Panaeolus papilionaceus]